MNGQNWKLAFLYSQSLINVSDLVRQLFPLIIFKNNLAMQRKLWTQAEDFALKMLVQEIGLSNWSLVAVKLSQACLGSERAGKQCRERWLNHLDLKIFKGHWNKSEENIIFQMHNKYGNKWKDIAKHLKGRNESDIKNHFYATLRKGIRRLNKILGLKINPYRLRKIKPSVLSKIAEKRAEDQSTQAEYINNGVFNLILKLSRCDSQTLECEDYIEDNELRRESENFLNKLLQQNQIYGDSKLKKRLRKKENQFPLRQIKSEGVSIGIDISQYLCLKGQQNQLEEARPKSNGVSQLSEENDSHLYKSQPKHANTQI